MRELEEAFLTMKNGRSLQTGVPPKVGAFNAYLKEGVFPCRWKVARLPLISKAKRDPELLSAHQPLYTLDMAEKVFEKLTRSRLVEAMRIAGDFEFEFRTGRSTVATIIRAGWMDAVHQVKAHSR